MFGRNRDADAMDPREMVARRLQQAGRTIAGETGSKVANGISAALGCGRIETCADPNCPNCAPVSD
ncbi:hypothetical protein AB0N99_30720 [Streptomyces sp. NPDC093272]|uniref:hypothetical protein n=1 Tax=Streptomyces sp. NPDC093272 TaxID=3154981 RepID=UPI00342139A4